MNLKKNLVLSMLAISMISCGSSYTSKTKIVTTADSVAYLMGVIDGQSQNKMFKQLGLDTLLNFDSYFEAMYNASNNKTLKMDLDSANTKYVTDYINIIQINAQSAITDTTGSAHPLNFTKSCIDSISYLLGAADGSSIGKGFAQSGLDTIGIKFNFYYEGLHESIVCDSTRINANIHRDMIQTFFTKIREQELMAQFGDNKREGEEFLAKNKANSDVITTESGLQYTIITEGTGEKPSIKSQVKVHYTGTLIDGTVFDSSVERGEPAVFGVFQVIPGWTEALQLMPVGSKWKLFIPQELAYGENGAGIIKPYSVLIFEVELLEIVK